MKILVLQLARLGDIFQTWPTFHALKRQGAEIHVLVRSRFRSAAENCEGIDRVFDFATDSLLAPVLEHPIEGMRPSLDLFDTLLARLDGEKYDRIINLSFSPLSSWLTFDLEMRAFQRGKAMSVSGYTRHVDGTLSIPDDASAYFFAQVGYRVQTGSLEGVNRLSLPRLFATVAGVDPIESDWRGPKEFAEPGISLQAGYVAFHIGASQQAKTLDAEEWGEIAARLIRRTQRQIVLLGSKEEMAKADEIVAAAERSGLTLNPDRGTTSRLVSLVGKTNVDQLFPIIRSASLLIAGDSALVQIASLVGTRVLNLSSRTVSHWETGPSTAGSRILIYGGAAPSAQTIVQETEAMLNEHEENTIADRVVHGPLEPIVEKTADSYADFQWQLVAAIYLGHPIPQLHTQSHVRRWNEAIQQWREVQSIENHQLNSLLNGTGDVKQIGEILARIDEVTKLLVEAEPRFGPIERWWTTERIRLGPQTQESLTEKYLMLNSQLETVLLSLSEIEGQDDGQQLDI